MSDTKCQRIEAIRQGSSSSWSMFFPGIKLRELSLQARHPLFLTVRKLLHNRVIFAKEPSVDDATDALPPIVFAPPLRFTASSNI